MNKKVLSIAFIAVLAATSCGRRHEEYPERVIYEDADFESEYYEEVCVDTCEIEEVYAVEVADSVAW